MERLTSCARWALAGALLAVAPSVPATLIINNATQGLYNAGIGTSLDTSGPSDPFPCANVACGDSSLTFPSAPNLSAAAAALGSWLTTPATPGGTWGGPQPIPGGWVVNTETAIIYTIDAVDGLTNVVLDLGVDNGIFVWLDGAYKFGARASGVANPGEYSPVLGDIGPGVHYLQILREDHGGGTGYVIELTADFVEAPGVPEPGTLALLGGGLLSVFAASRRRRGR